MRYPPIGLRARQQSILVPGIGATAVWGLDRAVSCRLNLILRLSLCFLLTRLAALPGAGTAVLLQNRVRSPARKASSQNRASTDLTLCAAERRSLGASAGGKTWERANLAAPKVSSRHPPVSRCFGTMPLSPHRPSTRHRRWVAPAEPERTGKKRENSSIAARRRARLL